MSQRRSEIPFAGYPLDRADELRKDPEAVAALWTHPSATVVGLWRGKPLVEEAGSAAKPVRLRVSDVDEDSVPDVFVRLFLGLGEGGEPHFAVAFDPAQAAPGFSPGAFVDLRPVAGRFSLDDAARVGTARSVLAWHRSHRFCARCGAATEVAAAGWKRRCGSCGQEHFPRVDPVVIALVTHDDQVLLGRGPTWPTGFFSCLAGFVEPGETIGEATRREVWEEAKVRVGDVTYLFGQPWPFPSSFMLGVHASASDLPIEVDGVELAEARWFSRDEVIAMLEGRHESAHAPFPIAVAHHLLRWWVQQA